MAEQVAGVVVWRGDELKFIPAARAVRIVQRPEITRVPGADIGMALIAGRVVAVIELDKRRDELVLCEIDGEPVALSGLRVRSAGFFDVADAPEHAVLLDGLRVSELDVAAELGRVEQGLWSGRPRP